MSNVDLSLLKSLINGLFQAEGLLSIYFKATSLSKGQISLISRFAIGQNYSKESAILFLQLQHCRAVPLSGSCGRPTRWVRPQPAPILAGTGSFILELTSSGSLHIKFVVSDTTDILTVVIPYLSEVYGQKAWCVQCGLTQPRWVGRPHAA
jgi:hypothetical protein